MIRVPLFNVAQVIVTQDVVLPDHPLKLVPSLDQEERVKRSDSRDPETSIIPQEESRIKEETRNVKRSESRDPETSIIPQEESRIKEEPKFIKRSDSQPRITDSRLDFRSRETESEHKPLKSNTISTDKHQISKSIKHQVSKSNTNTPPKEQVIDTRTTLDNLISSPYYNLAQAFTLVSTLKRQGTKLDSELLCILLDESINQKNAHHTDLFFKNLLKYGSATSLHFINVSKFYLICGDESRLFKVLDKVFDYSITFSASEWQSLWWSSEPLLKSTLVIKRLIENMDRQITDKYTDLIDNATLDMILSDAVDSGLLPQATLIFNKMSAQHTRLFKDQPCFSGSVLIEFLEALSRLEHSRPAFDVIEYLSRHKLPVNHATLLNIFGTSFRSGDKALAKEVCAILYNNSS